MADCIAGTVSPGIIQSQSHSLTPLNNLNKPLGRNSTHINDLPFDLFVLIWNLVRATDDNDQPYFPTVASHVCCTWRHYALEALSFWSTVDFRTKRVNMERAANQAELRPISVSLVNTLNKFSGRNSNHINNLPFDIFVLIWNLARTTDDNDRPHFPVVVSHVCRTWRHYALEVLSFWSTVDFRTSEVNAEKAQLWLQRSKDSPVNINIGPEPFERASISKVPEKVARVIVDRLLDASAPVLEVLELSTEDGTKWEPKPFREGKAPALLDISIEGRFQKYFLERFPNLRRLRLTDPGLSSTNYSENITYLHKVLSKLPQLETLLIDNTQRRFEDSRNDTHFLPINLHSPLTHDSLMHLSLHVSYANRNVIFGSLNLPHLRYFPNHRLPLHEFTFGLCILEYMKRAHPFPGLVSLRLGGSLESYLEYSPVHERRNAEILSHLEEALSGAPLLESLSFEYVAFGGDETISCLSRVCPRLEWLTYHICAGYTLKGIMSIVEGRRARMGFEPLLHLTIREWPWDAKRVDDKATWRLLEATLEARSVVPDDSKNLYLSRFDVK
ncbi:hypothetical protein FRC05_010981 [Tulasnella sp. 425]|nr:hypothetical protein FRC05_010981 [Tulasnella sp. 425]